MDVALQAGPVVAVAAAVGLLVAVGTRVSNRVDITRARLQAAGADRVAAPPGLAQVLRVIVLSWLFYLVVFHSLSNTPLDVPMFFGVHQRFWQQPNAVAFLLAGLGLHKLLSKLSRRLRVPGTTQTLVAATVAIVLVATQIQASFPSHDQSQNECVGKFLLLCTGFPLFLFVPCFFWRWYCLSRHTRILPRSYVERFGRATLAAAQNNSIIITADDLKWGSLQYLQHCEGVRCVMVAWGVMHSA